MNQASVGLRDLRVEEAMNTEVVTLPASATMEEAANAFASHGINGAPVVDEAGHVVGMLSATDFAKLDETENRCSCHDFHSDEFELKKPTSSDCFRIVHEATDSLRQHMTTALQTVGMQQTLHEASRYMLGQQIHRLLVIDEHSRPVGVLSPLDILAALVETAAGDSAANGNNNCQEGAS